MTISQKCNCCTHEAICSKKVQYESACKEISNAVAYAERDLLKVSIKCSHFMEQSAIRRGGAE